MKYLKIKRKVIAMLVVIGLAMVNTNVYAQEIICKEQVKINDCNTPSETWNISKDGSYSLSGNTNGYALYTLYKFHGKKSYEIKIKNHGDKTIKVYTVKTLSKRQATIKPGKTKTFTYKPGSTSTKFYLKFTGVSIDVSGTIK